MRLNKTNACVCLCCLLVCFVCLCVEDLRAKLSVAGQVIGILELA